MSTQGALYLAHERQALNVRDDEVAIINHPPDRWPITDCMTDRALINFARTLLEFGIFNTGERQ